MPVAKKIRNWNTRQYGLIECRKGNIPAEGHPAKWEMGKRAGPSLYAEFFGGSVVEPGGLIRRVGREVNV
jgi:hypothetical protein